MPFSATVLNVLIASPSDVSGEREAIAQSRKASLFRHVWSHLGNVD
jgi:hypothetical protein